MRTILTPGVSSGTRIIDCCLCAGAEGSVLPIKIAILHRGSPAPEDHHFRPWITYVSPSRRIVAPILVASEEATSGSVMEKHDRISQQAAALAIVPSAPLCHNAPAPPYSQCLVPNN